MLLNSPQQIISADLVIDTQSGQIQNHAGKQDRLTPVNMRVLAVLVANEGKVISRATLFEKVWPNQEVSDEALTRSISDIRAVLSKLSGFSPLIETIPKKGYRWVQPLKTSEQMVPSHSSPENLNDSSPHTNQDLAKFLAWLKWLPLYLSAVLAMLILGVWFISMLAERPEENIAILPPKLSSEHAHLIESYQNVLYEKLLKSGEYKILSANVVHQFNGAVYPELYRKFATRWIIESAVTKSANGNIQVVTVIVDARNAFVTERVFSNYRLVEDTQPSDWQTIEANKVIALFSLMSSP